MHRTKRCRVCRQKKSLKNFHKCPHGKYGRRGVCKRCRSNSIGDRAHNLCRSAKRRATRDKREFDITPEFIGELMALGVCSLTGVKLNFHGGLTWDSPSIDRIDSRRGYTKDNVRIVLQSVNCMLGNWGVERTLDLADRIRRAIENETQDPNDLP